MFFFIALELQNKRINKNFRIGGFMQDGAEGKGEGARLGRMQISRVASSLFYGTSSSQSGSFHVVQNNRLADCLKCS